MVQRRTTEAEYLAEGERIFGRTDPATWPFVCPCCGHVATALDYKAAGAPPGAVGFSCIGRWLPKCREAFTAKKDAKGPGPCNYAGGGLINVSPVHIEGRGNYFEFASPDLRGATGGSAAQG